MRQDLPALTEALLSAATRAGADGADALASDGRAVQIGVRGGALEEAERSEGVDLGLRVFVGQRQACVSASDISERTMAEMAERAVAMAREAPEDPYIGLATPDQLARARDAEGLEKADTTDEPSAAELQEDARRAEAAAMEV
ncbi:MAG: PmbA protein, partial [Polaromonas sp.]